ncbi:DUF2975 domain-containing protein [Bifidobacterium sp. ESL0784]|uniref:DUF2975 domain-containing protein n=1 Tax=Bifidobacterium sp. ESL0784 TaxID=2983231 RepID=UPI0023FA3223|nr:DUF2975 domain-containing protein [Bifidobacterium sp. ESL0784]MDF7641515.1 DUF2975 domain-containing protein [Bifidobacterium sp. ESL0784]
MKPREDSSVSADKNGRDVSSSPTPNERKAHMSHRTLAVLLEATDAFAVVICLAIALFVLPSAERVGDLKHGSALFAGIGMLPLTVVAVCAWRLFSAVGREETFTVGNVRRLRTIGAAFGVSAAIWLVELALAAFNLNRTRGRTVLGTGVAFVFCGVLAVVSAALASLTAAATELKNENDLVI